MSCVYRFGSDRRASQPQQPCKGPQAVVAWWSSPAPQCMGVALGCQPRRAESLAVFQREWAQSSGKKMSGSNKK